jgi:hypothetical protein
MAVTNNGRRAVTLAIFALLACAVVADQESMAQQPASAPPFLTSASLLNGILPVQVNLPPSVTMPVEARPWFNEAQA